MPLSSKEKVVRHRAHINSDPKAREEYLTKRRASYQRQKTEGKIVGQPISQLSNAEKKKKREKCGQHSKIYREKRKALQEVMNLTPESIDSSVVDPPREHELVNLADHAYANVVDEILPLASSSPEKASEKEVGKVKMRCKKLEKEKHQLKKEIWKLKMQLKNTRQDGDKWRKSVERQKKGTSLSEKNKARGKKKLAQERKEKVLKFLCRDEISRMLPGKKDTITKNKQKVQRRVLSKSLSELHSQYNAEVGGPHSLSYRQFVRYRPFYITEPKASDRNTCACLDHENVKLLIDRLVQRGLLKTSSVSELLSTIVCDTSNKTCMYRVCAKCCYSEVAFAEIEETTHISWQQWKRETQSVEEKTFTHFVKVSQTGSLEDLKALFNKKLDALARHQFNWLHQVETCRNLKETLTENEVVVHLDFSENYACKLNTEVQAFHFGGSRQQATIHTSVVYTAGGTQSYATISDSLRHDERAVWAHLEPVVKEIIKTNPRPTTLHILSDGPVTQYRNKKNFYLLSTVPFLWGFEQVTWNFSEKSHGKGAPDGVGGALKRCADAHVQRGKDIQTPKDLYDLLKSTESNIKFHWIEDVSKFDEAVPDRLPAVKGTLTLHQVTSKEAGTIQHREVSCFCSRPQLCLCYNPTEVKLKENDTQTAQPDEAVLEELPGKFVIVSYDGRPFVGQVLRVIGEEIQISCMQQSGTRNVFVWPETPDITYYFKEDVKETISEPEPYNSRSSKLCSADWHKLIAPCKKQTQHKL